MKSLQTIQKLSKIGKILSKIVFIFCVVGFCLCLAGIISLAVGAPMLQIGDVTLHGLIEQETDITVNTMYAAMAAAAVFCLGEAILSRFAVHYFNRELEDGTPFTFGGAKELKRLGILAICIPIGTSIVAHIVYAVLEQVLEGVSKMDISSTGSVSLGIMMIVTAVICKYGAEVTAEK